MEDRQTKQNESEMERIKKLMDEFDTCTFLDESGDFKYTNPEVKSIIHLDDMNHLGNATKNQNQEHTETINGFSAKDLIELQNVKLEEDKPDATMGAVMNSVSQTRSDPAGVQQPNERDTSLQKSNSHQQSYQSKRHENYNRHDPHNHSPQAVAALSISASAGSGPYRSLTRPPPPVNIYNDWPKRQTHEPNHAAQMNQITWQNQVQQLNQNPWPNQVYNSKQVSHQNQNYQPSQGPQKSQEHHQSNQSTWPNQTHYQNKAPEVNKAPYMSQSPWLNPVLPLSNAQHNLSNQQNQAHQLNEIPWQNQAHQVHRQNQASRLNQMHQPNQAPQKSQAYHLKQSQQPNQAPHQNEAPQLNRARPPRHTLRQNQVPAQNGNLRFGYPDKGNHIGPVHPQYFTSWGYYGQFDHNPHRMNSPYTPYK